MFYAACVGDTMRLAHLLGQGAQTTHRDVDGRTAVHRAAVLGHKTALELLIGSGADVDAKNNVRPLSAWAVKTPTPGPPLSRLQASPTPCLRSTVRLRSTRRHTVAGQTS